MSNQVSVILYELGIVAQNATWPLVLPAVVSSVMFVWMVILIRRSPGRNHSHDRFFRLRRHIAVITLLISICATALYFLPLNIALVRTDGVQEFRFNGNQRKLLVFLHGWQGSDQTWNRFPLLATCDPRLQDFNIISINYTTRLALRSPNIPLLADKIRLELARRAHASEVYILSHSLGGVIARLIMVQNALMPKDQKLNIPISVSIGSPFSGGTNIVSLASMLRVSKALIQDVEQGSSFLVGLDLLWRSLQNLRRTGTNQSSCIHSFDDAVVTNVSAHTSCDRKERYLRWGHTDAVKPSVSTDPRYSIPINMILSGVANYRNPLGPEAEISRTITRCISASSSIVSKTGSYGRSN